MATGDQNDVYGRIKSLLPAHWFVEPTPIIDALLAGLANGGALIYSLIQYAKNQTRIATASDGFLDLISYDFFGLLLPRRSAEQDTPFRARITSALLREKATRNGLIKSLVALTGRAPLIIEPTRPLDTGVYGGICGYGSAGAYGSLVHNAQAWVVAYRPSNSGIPLIAGYGSPSAGYSTASYGEWTSLSMIIGYVTDANIFAAVDAAKAAGTTMWTRLSN